MLGRNRNIAYVRYDNTGRIVPGGPIITSVKPKVGDWVAVDDVLTTTPNYKLRGFIRYIKNGDYVAGSLILQHDAPQDGNWKEVYVLYPSPVVPTTTTTTTNIPVTTTTTSSSTSTSTTTSTTSTSTSTTTSTSTSTSTTSTTTTLTSNDYFELYRCSDNATYYSKDYPNGTFSDLGGPRVTGYVDFELTTFIINATLNNATNPTGVEITSTGFFGCPTTSTTTTAGPATTTTTTTFGPIDYDLSVLCPVIPNQSMNVLATNFTGGVGTARFWSRFTYLTKAEADNPSIEYFGPFNNPGGIQWGTDYIPPTVVEVWVSVKDANGNQTSKSIVLNCPTITTTTTQYTPFTTTTSTTPNPSDPYKSYRVNSYICDQQCTPTLYNQTITVPQAGSVQIGKYYLSSNTNISYLILEQVAWTGNSGNDITTFTAYDFCYEACGYTPTTTTTTTILSAPVNTVFVNYDVVPGSGQDVNTVFVKYDIQ